MLRHRIGKLSLSAVAAAVTVALPLALITTDAAQAGPQCYGYYTFKSDHYDSKRTALDHAISGWSSWVSSHYGKSYAYWSHAKYPSTWCKQYDYYWVCWAKAEPCYWAPSYKPAYKPSYHSGGGGSGY